MERDAGKEIEWLREVRQFTKEHGDAERGRQGGAAAFLQKALPGIEKRLEEIYRK